MLIVLIVLQVVVAATFAGALRWQGRRLQVLTGYNTELERAALRRRADSCDCRFAPRPLPEWASGPSADPVLIQGRPAPLALPSVADDFGAFAEPPEPVAIAALSHTAETDVVMLDVAPEEPTWWREWFSWPGAMAS